MPRKPVTFSFNPEVDEDILSELGRQRNASDWVRTVLKEKLASGKKPESELRGKAEAVTGVPTAAPPAPPLDSKDELTDAELDDFIALQLEKEKVPAKGGGSTSKGEPPTIPPSPAPAANVVVMPANFYCSNGHPIGYFNPLSQDDLARLKKTEPCKCGAKDGNWK